jgi:hypothetical protein
MITNEVKDWREEPRAATSKQQDIYVLRIRQKFHALHEASHAQSTSPTHRPWQAQLRMSQVAPLDDTEIAVARLQWDEFVIQLYQMYFLSWRRLHHESLVCPLMDDNGPHHPDKAERNQLQ